jgi:hypothetical protein
MPIKIFIASSGSHNLAKGHNRPQQLAKLWRECFNQNIETGVLHDVGLRNTLEPDPDNTGVGSFRSQAFFFLDSQHEFSCFIDFKNKGNSCPVLLPPVRIASHLNSQRAERQRLLAAGRRDCCLAA